MFKIEPKSRLVPLIENKQWITIAACAFALVKIGPTLENWNFDLLSMTIVLLGAAILLSLVSVKKIKKKPIPSQRETVTEDENAWMEENFGDVK